MRSGHRRDGDPAAARPPLMARLHSSLSALTESEQKVAAAVRSDPQRVVYASVTELAEAAGVGETTVLRFARKLGYRNYHAFKMDLARDIFSEGAAQDGEAASSPASDDLLHRATEENRRVIVDTYQMLDRAVFERAVAMLADARQIHFYGAGHSGITAQDARYRFWRLGFPAAAFADPHFQLMAAATLQPGDVAVGLSVSGSTRDTVECLAAAKARGAGTIAITGYAQAPIGRVADVVLVTATREMPLQSGSFTSKIGQLHMLDLLVRALVRSCPERVRQHQEQVGQAVSTKLY
ncbi:MurR/RpiR family transcriptional regulator [Geochorda subterranea]|uniref:MurR/RpiR family transcriptional regulator n=1 Tax=Geochorda subterranea TaxID=3109564 RepID=A0ABZ1BMU5_9FIRM|nr:MurR/RpiR family transcriptional regulator [Limnochorda sp. LNt]WRP13868.1 MurR/RpiR family transcriptional regulator [Limnochorda sp. LNt]